MESIIHSISSTLTGMGTDPKMIYMGIGTFAGMLTDVNGVAVLEPKNYHQFPPTIQDIFMKYRDMHLFIILIDPSQEKPIYMSTDQELKKIFLMELNGSIFQKIYQQIKQKCILMNVSLFILFERMSIPKQYLEERMKGLLISHLIFFQYINCVLRMTLHLYIMIFQVKQLLNQLRNFLSFKLRII